MGPAVGEAGRWTLSRKPSPPDWNPLSPTLAGPVPPLPLPGQPSTPQGLGDNAGQRCCPGGTQGQARWNVWMGSWS